MSQKEATQRNQCQRIEECASSETKKNQRCQQKIKKNRETSKGYYCQGGANAVKARKLRVLCVQRRLFKNSQSSFYNI